MTGRRGDTFHWAVGDLGSVAAPVSVSRRHPAVLSLPSEAASGTGAVLLAVSAPRAPAAVISGGPSIHRTVPVLALAGSGASAASGLVPVDRGGRVVLTTRGRHRVKVLVRFLAYAAPDAAGSQGAQWLLARRPRSVLRARGGVVTLKVAGRLGLPRADSDAPPTGAVLSVEVPPGRGVAAMLPVAGATNDGRTLTAADAASPYMRLASGQSGDATLVVPLSADGTARFRIMSRRVHIRLLGATSGDLQVRAGTLLLRGQDLAALAEIDDTALRFHRIPADLSNIQPGQVVVAALTPTTPQGLLRKVTAVSRSGSDLVLSTIPATLSDVLLKGSIRADQDLNQSNITAFTPLRHGVWLAPLARAAHSNSGFGASFDTDIVPDQPIVSPASIQITGNGIHVNPSIHFSANASLFPPRSRRSSPLGPASRSTSTSRGRAAFATS